MVDADARLVRQIFARAAAWFLLVFAVLVGAQTLLIGASTNTFDDSVRLLLCSGIDLVVVVAMLFVLPLVPIERWNWPRRITALLGIVVVAVLLRATLQVVTGSYPLGDTDGLLLDGIVATMSLGIAIAVALAFAEVQERLRRQQREIALAAVGRSQVYTELQQEELADRKRTAERLREAFAEAVDLFRQGITTALEHLESEEPEAAAQSLRELASTAQRRHASDAAGLHRLVYYGGAEAALADAVPALAHRRGETIEVQWALDADVFAADESHPAITLPVRMLVMQLLEAAIDDALVRKARSARIDVGLDGHMLLLSVDDDGLVTPELPDRIDVLLRRLELFGGEGSLGTLGTRMLRLAHIPLLAEA